MAAEPTTRPGTTSAGPAWGLRCLACGQRYPLVGPAWTCGCGGMLAIVRPPLERLTGDDPPWSLWRYAPTLPPVEGWETITLGEGMTPLVPAGDGVAVKVDFLQPTLSFKDRGAAVVLAAAAGAGVKRVAIDSSGNAGTAVAAYAARAGIAAEVVVPAGTSAKKLAALRAHGATVAVVAGDRAAAAEEARDRVAATGAFYASHVYQPLFAEGVKTYVLELWEQLGGRLPAVLVVPAGNGTLVLGAAAGFETLAALGLLTATPRLVAVQAERCAPLAGRQPAGPTAADGIAIAAPPRKAEVLAAVGRSGGAVVTVSEDAIQAAGADLAARGLWVEPTAAVAWAAWQQRASWPIQPADRAGGDAVVVLTGAGLKAGTVPARSEEGSR